MELTFVFNNLSYKTGGSHAAMLMQQEHSDEDVHKMRTDVLQLM